MQLSSHKKNAQEPFTKLGAVRDLVFSLWLPVIWALLLMLDIFLFSDTPPSNMVLIIFDKLIMFSCFLLYPFEALQMDRWLPSYLLFACQFLFWWVFSYSVSYMIHNLNRRTQSKK